ncbi:MAG: hypothetical protein WAV28_01025 [Sedimentisphaerales bacterium]
MPENIRYFGLCMSCRNASSCTFPRESAKPAFYCEEFEIETTVSIIPPEKEQPLAMDSSAAKDKDSTEFIPSRLRRAGFIGLCSDCEGRQTCTFPKPEGGIWHCEEYR